MQRGNWPSSIMALLMLTPSTAFLSAQKYPERPVFKLLRYEEDWSQFRNAGARTEWVDSLKYIPLSRREGWYLSLGGEVRELMEYFDHPSWGREPADNKYLLQRYMLHTDLRFGSRVRFFGQLKSGIETNRKGGPRPADEDLLDVHQAFVDATVWQSAANSVTLRVGRQEMEFGSSRIISAREGPNVRQSFDGVRLAFTFRGWQLDTFSLKPAETSRWIFDDSPDHTRSFWGAYGVRPFPGLPKAKVDLYYLGLDRKRGRYDAGLGREQRHSLGARLWGAGGSWDYNYEGLFQGGRFSSGGIRAWTIASDSGYRLEGVKWRPRFGVKADIASGDQNPDDKTLGTFNALFPKGSYFSEADLLGPYNLMDVHPSVQFNLTQSLRLTADGAFFFRQSTRDGIYGIAGNLLESGRGVAARYIGSHARAQMEWTINRHMSFSTTYLHFFPADFLRQAGPNRAVNFVGTRLSYRL
ncbi:MAG: alginate export family protein [Bryobacteraceae bacterium]